MDRELVEFVEYSFETIWSLEVLLMTYHQPDRAWSPAELVADLRSSELVVRKCLENLVAAGLITLDDDNMARYRPASVDQDRLVSMLSTAYRTTPAAIRRIILRNSTHKLRTFSNSFKILGD